MTEIAFFRKRRFQTVRDRTQTKTKAPRWEQGWETLGTGRAQGRGRARCTQDLETHDKAKPTPVRLGLVVGSREFFNGAPALATALDSSSRSSTPLMSAIAILPVEATKNGAVQSREDARRNTPRISAPNAMRSMAW